jgi:AcrR family transcriptional regulator
MDPVAKAKTTNVRESSTPDLGSRGIRKLKNRVFSDLVLGCLALPEPQNQQRVSDGMRREAKGARTRSALLTRAVQIARREGVDAVTFGSVAERAGLTRSAVFSHFGSRDKLVLDTLQVYRQTFSQTILEPGRARTPGLPRLKFMFVAWTDSFLRGPESGCILIRASANHHSQSPAVTNELQVLVHDWRSVLHECVSQSIALGQLHPSCDAWQVVYELYGMALALHQEARFLGAPMGKSRTVLGFNRLIRTYLADQ